METNKIIKCACGCGKELEELDKYGRTRKMLVGHARKGIKLSIETKNKMSIASKGKPKSLESRIKMSEFHRGIRLSDKTKMKISFNSSRYWLGKKLTEEHKHKLSLAKLNKIPTEKQLKHLIKLHSYWIGKKLTEEHKHKLSLAKLGKKMPPCSPEHRKKLSKARRIQVLPVKDTTIEIKIQNFLKELGITFFTHQYIKEIEHGYQCDILIPSMKLVIECDGVFWHRFPIGNKIDHIRTKELIDNGFKVLRLWENEIRVMSIENFKNKLNNLK